MAIEDLPGPVPTYIQAKIIMMGLNGALDWCAEVTGM